MKFDRPSEETLKLLRTTASNIPEEAALAQRALAQSLSEVVRKGVMDGDIVSDIYDPIPLAPGSEARFPVHFLAPGSESRYVAFDLPAQGRVPERHIEGDEVLVKTYKVGNAIDWDLDYNRDARFDVIREASEVLRDGFISKNNTDGWTIVLACAADRALVANDAAAGSGVFTKELAAQIKTTYLRNRGGNAVRGGLTDLYVSLEAIQDIRAATLTQLDDITRREVLLGGDNPIPTLYGMAVHPLTELGVGQAYQTIYSNFGGSLAAGDTELVIGLDLTDRRSFKNPIRDALQVFDDPMLHRQQRAGMYAWMRHGYACLDNRMVIAGSF